MLKIYHNPRCKTSRAALQYLNDNGFFPEVFEYLKNPPDPELLKMLLIKLNMKPIELVRKQEEAYKMQYKGKNFTDEEWIRIMAVNPRLIRRPIIEMEHKALIGDEPGSLLKFSK